jgi:hypothetical protein
MTRLRFTLAQLMALVLCLGLCFAALRNADPFVASVTFTLTTLTISTALVCALIGKGRARTAWIGFAVFGWAYLLIDLLPPRDAGRLPSGPVPWPPRLIEWGLTRLQPYLWPVPPKVYAQDYLTAFEQVSHSLAIILFSLLGAVLARLLASKEARPNP